ncbi:MAG: HAMP domain-containing protein [Deltaproteobacteria bacterium]|jgi:nitrogen fixation/metabolism regulation signal transduction histidine kinase|nr:HAMP domain-containing protein [Deltaproteobacteria bacterium]
MNAPAESEHRTPAERRLRGRRHEKALVALALLGMLLLVLIQRRLLNLGPGLSSNQGVVTLVSINLSILTLAILLFMILKGLYRVFFERQSYGSLQTKMVVSFISLSLIPTLLIFYFSYRLVGRGVETWFSVNQVETTRGSIRAVEEAASLHGKAFPALARGALFEFAQIAFWAGSPARSPEGLEGAQAALQAMREDAGLSTLEWYGPDGTRLALAADPALPGGAPPPLDAQIFRTCPQANAPLLAKTALEGAMLRRLVFTVPEPGKPGAPPRAAAMSAVAGDSGPKSPAAASGAPGSASPPENAAASGASAPSGPNPSPVSPVSPGPPASSEASAGSPGIPPSSGFPAAAGLSGPPAAPLGFFAAGDDGLGDLESELAGLRAGLAKSEAALGIAGPFRVTQLTSLAAVTLLAVFLSVWIGSHLAQSLAAPVTELVEGTRRVAGGDLDFVLKPVHRSGEMADLVAAFNQMTMELKESYAETDRRRRFAETVLRQVSSGVMVLDPDLRVLDMNQAAAAMLKTTPGEARRGPARGPVLDLLGPIGSGRPPKGHVRLSLPGGETLSLMADRARLKGEGGAFMGWLITFDDISELEKAQRLSAWREVARRIAHEIKNPLTPIALAAQRLKRRFAERLGDEEDFHVFEECTEVIARQVDGMRRLVDEFSRFARLPQAAPRPADITKTAEEAVALFREANPGIAFSLKLWHRPPPFLFDPEQLGRALSNLLSNACAAVKGAGSVEIEIDQDPEAGVELTVSDDGPGVPEAIRDHVFEPYVTTGDGQGLGLAIVKAIVSDHGGLVRVYGRKPRGTSFTVTLPFREIRPKAEDAGGQGRNAPQAGEGQAPDREEKAGAGQVPDGEEAGYGQGPDGEKAGAGQGPDGAVAGENQGPGWEKPREGLSA